MRIFYCICVCDRYGEENHVGGPRCRVGGGPSSSMSIHDGEVGHFVLRDSISKHECLPANTVNLQPHQM